MLFYSCNVQCRIRTTEVFKHFQKILSGISLLSNSLDRDQDRHCVSPDLDPNCLQRLSADDKSQLAEKN